MLGRRREGKAEQKSGAIGDGGIVGQSAAETAAEALTQGEAEADARHAAGGGGGRSAERLEQAAGRFFGEAGAVVAEAEGGEACVVGCGHDFNVETLFGGIGAGVFAGVVDEIEKDLFDR